MGEKQNKSKWVRYLDLKKLNLLAIRNMWALSDPVTDYKKQQNR